MLTALATQIAADPFAKVAKTMKTLFEDAPQRVISTLIDIWAPFVVDVMRWAAKMLPTLTSQKVQCPKRHAYHVAVDPEIVEPRERS